MKTSVALSLLAAAVSLGACGGTGGTTSAEATPAATPVVIEITLDDTLTITPPALTVQRNVPVRFVVTNAGKTQHEFVLGDEAVQAEHEQEMGMDMGMAMHEHAYALMVEPGQTKSLDWRFEAPGETYAGCHYPGHYAAGMKAMISVTD